MISLRNQLLFLISIAQIILVLGAFWLSYDKGKHEAEELLDGQLVLSMRLIEAQVLQDKTFGARARPGSSPVSDVATSREVMIELVDDRDRGEYEPELAFAAWNADGREIIRSSNASQMQLVPTVGFSDVLIDGRPWRTFTKRTADDQYQLQVAHPLDTRNRVGLEVAERVTYPMLFSLPLLLLAILYAINFSLKPVNRLARIISERTASSFEAINPQIALKELMPVVTAFNQLLSKLERGVVRERQFTADAAHELRSPLAGLKIQAQVAMAAQDPEIRHKALGNVLLGVERSERLVDQLLRLARLDPDQNNEISFSTVSLRHLVLEALDSTQRQRSELHQNVELQFPQEDLFIVADHDLLMVMVSNILNNASKYSPQDTTIFIHAQQHDDRIELIFRDQGPGIPEDELSEITKPFRRGQAVTAQGSGLGLAIVERIATLHGASLELKNHPAGGLEVHLTFSVSRDLI